MIIPHLFKLSKELKLFMNAIEDEMPDINLLLCDNSEVNQEADVKMLKKLYDLSSKILS